MFTPEFWYGMAGTGLVLAVGHWIPSLFSLGGRTGRIFTYAYGVAAMLAGQALWLFTLPGNVTGWQVWLGLLAFAVVSGLVTALAHGYDYVANLRVKYRAGVNDDAGTYSE